MMVGKLPTVTALVVVGVCYHANNVMVSAYSAPKSTVFGNKMLTKSNAIAVPMETDQQQQRNINKEFAWVENLDYKGFGREVRELGKELTRNQGLEDVRHLEKIVSWRNLCAVVGVASMWTTPNPITILALSTWTYASWTMIAHHTCHGGYNRVDAGRCKSGKFAKNSVFRRIVDWCDWMHPEAWNIEHNR